MLIPPRIPTLVPVRPFMGITASTPTWNDRLTQITHGFTVPTADPVATGPVVSLAQPGGNVTGLSFVGTEVAGKQLELLNEAAPRLARVGSSRRWAPSPWPSSPPVPLVSCL